MAEQPVREQTEIYGSESQQQHAAPVVSECLVVQTQIRNAEPS